MNASDATRVGSSLRFAAVPLIILLLGLLAATAAWAVAPSTVRISRGLDGNRPLAGASASAHAISADGRYLAFTSDADDFAPVHPDSSNVFVKDLSTGSLDLVNRHADGSPARGAGSPAMSADGRYVAFRSSDPDLTPGDTNGGNDVFVRDRLQGTLDRVSDAPGGAPANGTLGGEIAISADGRFVAFVSRAENLVAGDTNTLPDVFVRDRASGVTERVSPASSGAYYFTTLGISGDGRYVAFTAIHPNRLTIPPQFPLVNDVLVRDRTTQELEIISVAGAGAFVNATCDYPSISNDGRYVAFSSQATNIIPGGSLGAINVYLRDRLNGSTELASRATPDSPGQGQGYRGIVSPGGNRVVFSSNLPNIVTGKYYDRYSLFSRDIATGIAQQVDIASDRSVANASTDPFVSFAVSDTGRYVAFSSLATNLDPADRSGGSDLFLRDIQNEVTSLAGTRADGAQGVTAATTTDVVLSGNGAFAAFRSTAENLAPNDHNGTSDVFVWNVSARTAELVSLSSEGAQSEGPNYSLGFERSSIALSEDGRFVAFESRASNLVGDDTNDTWDVFVRDRAQQTTVRVSLANDGSEGNGSSAFGVDISSDGRYVAFTSSASNLTPGDSNVHSDVFVRDLLTNTTERVSVASDGAPAMNGSSWRPQVNSDGRYVLFESYAPNLVPGDTNNNLDVFLHDRVTHVTERVSLTAGGMQIAQFSNSAALTPDGRYVAFSTPDGQVVSGDSNSSSDVFVRDRVAGTTVRVSVSNDGSQLPDASSDAAISDDATIIAFRSYNGSYKVRLRDRTLGTTTEVASTGSNFAQVSANGLSGDGRKVAFLTRSSDLDPSTLPGAMDAFIHDRGAPANPPGNPVATPIGNSVRLTWLDQSSDETGFRVERRVGAGSFELLTIAAAGATELLDADTEWNTTYSYRIRALSPYGDSPFSTVVTAFTQLPVPAPPGGLRAMTLSKTSIRLAWTDESELEDGFLIERSTEGGTSFTPVATTGIGVLTYDDIGLDPGTAYLYQVRAVNASGQSSASEPATATTIPEAPLAPTGFVATVLSKSEIRLTWTDSSSNESGFRLERALGLGELSELQTLPPGATTFTDTGLASETKYRYRLRAFNLGGESDSVMTEATTNPEAPLAPAGFVAIRLSESEIRLTWTDSSSNESGFRLERALGLGEFSELKSLPPGAVAFTDTGLAPETHYRYRLRAFNPGGESEAIVAGTTTIPVPNGVLSVAPKVAFGAVKVGATRRRMLVIRNKSRTRTLRVTLSHPGLPYLLGAPSETFYLGPGSGREAPLIFKPTARGKSTGAFLVTSSDPARPSVRCVLSGKGK